MESNFPVAEFRDTLIYDILELEKQTITLRLGDNDNQLLKPTVVDVTENIITLNFNKETKH